MTKLIAIDGNSLMHRAFYALPDMTTAEGVPTGALHGFLSMLLKLIEREPDYLCVAFDMHGKTFRHDTYPEYKAGRRETPDDLRKQFPILHDLLRNMGIAVIECPSYEADDILGTLSQRGEAQGIDTLVVTGDRDALQLIGVHTHVLLTKKGISDTVECTEAFIHETYGLAPDQMRDLKGLMGDNSDNIPGIPGVGEKTALKLLAEYGSLSSVLKHSAEIPGKLGERVRENAALAEMSYSIGTICRQAPIADDWQALKFSGAEMAKAQNALFQLELRAIAARLLASTGMPVEEKEKSPIRLREITTASELADWVRAIPQDAVLGIVAEESLSFSVSEEEAVTFPQGGDLFSAPLEPKIIWEALSGLLSSDQPQKIVFDAKRLRHILRRYGIQLRGVAFDAMIGDYLLNAVRPAGTLAALTQRREQTDAPNAAHLVRMAPSMQQELEKAGMTSLYRDMEAKLSDVLFDMECIGFPVDDAVLTKMKTEFSTKISALTDEIYALAGEKFNILSPKQLGEILFGKLNLATQRKTKTGYSTDADTLEKLSSEHPIVPLILEYRLLSKLTSTFLDGLLTKRSESDGRVRTQFNQCITATGRISSTEPNLQNIPVRTEIGREIRKAFVASPGNVLVGADYSQIELRLLAHISGDDNMIRAFQSGEDIHRITASEVFRTPFDEVTKEMRSAAKAVNFGIVYGISDFGLARNLDIPVPRAREYIQMYFTRYPGVHAFMEQAVADGKERGYAVTMFGRRRALPELSSSNYNTRSFGERVAMNMPIQGSAADIIKLAMVRVHERIQEEQLAARLILQVHDELIVDTPEIEADRVSKLLGECMEHVCELSVPLVADVHTGHSWYETK